MKISKISHHDPPKPPLSQSTGTQRYPLAVLNIGQWLHPDRPFPVDRLRAGKSWPSRRRPLRSGTGPLSTDKLLIGGYRGFTLEIFLRVAVLLFQLVKDLSRGSSPSEGSIVSAHATMDAILPNDVLLMVGEHLDQHQDRWNLIFVSQHFHDLFLPLVYRKAPLHNWRGAQSFLHAITKRPALANAVRELDLSGWQTAPITDDERNDVQNSASLKELVLGSSHTDEEVTQWEESLGKGLGDAWMALLLPLLTQLRKLHLAYATRTPFLDMVMQRAVRCEKPFHTQPAFRYLQGVSLHRREEIDPCERHEVATLGDQPPSAALLMPFFQLPSMRAIFADSVIDPSSIITDDHTSNKDEEENGEEADASEKSPSGLSSITEIDLRASSGNHGMEALIASCADLKSFKYQHSDSHVHSQGYQPSAFYRSLTRSKDTLHTLWLDHYGDHYPFTAAGLNQTHDEWFGSLADFTALREVRIRLPNLLDIRYQSEPATPLVNCLPQSLETLYIEGCEERHLSILSSQLQTVLKHRQSKAPRLQRLDIEGAFQNVSSDDSGDSSPPTTEIMENAIKSKITQAVEPLHVDCIAAGIDLHVHDRAFSRSPCIQAL